MLTDTSGYIVAIVDNNGISKAIVQGVSQEQKEVLVKSFESDNIQEFKGKISLPV